MEIVARLFERLQTWAERFPDRPAHRVASAGTTATTALTYPELLTRTGAVATHLRARLPDDHSPVLVVGHKEPEMLAGFLGAVGSGHPYVPVDDSLPAHRVETIARMSGAAVALTPPEIAALPAGESDGELVAPGPAQPFYLIFTSGSTGEPKGVVFTAGFRDDADTAAFTDGLRAALAERLPVYMLPRKFYLQATLPITANGKADRRLLASFAASGNRPTES